MTPRDRLSSLDGSFLRVETENAHMHVAWKGIFAPHPARPRPALSALRASVASRLRHAPRFRQRLAFPPSALGEPYWVDDAGFDIRRHVTSWLSPRATVSLERFDELADAALSQPLDRAHPLWHIHLVPRLEDGRAGILCKIHHALVDGKSAVELALLLFDLSPDAVPEPPDDWAPAPAPGAAGMALAAVSDGVGETLRGARGAARMAAAPVRSAGRITDTLRRTALAIESDLLRPAPSSYLNAKIGPRRTLVTHGERLAPLLAVKDAAGVTLNDVCLAVVAGAMRELAFARRGRPRPLKVMVPVSVRSHEQRGDLGNRISFAFIELPAQEASATRRLALVHEQTSAFKRSSRPAGTESVLGALGLLPSPLKDRAAKLAASPRVYNLTVSNVPGPRVPVYMLGAELQEAYPVVPVPEAHALSIGIFTYGDRAFFGAYADPEALPEARSLPSFLSASLLTLARAFPFAAGPPAAALSPAGRPRDAAASRNGAA